MPWWLPPPPPPPPAALTGANVYAALTSGEGYLTHVRTALYFALFLGALSGVLRSFPWCRLARTQPLVAVAAPPFALVALVLTWRLILLFFVDFTSRHAGHPDPPNLFVEAYVLVCDDPAGWWWSQALLCWVAVACPLAHAEASRRRLSATVTLAYISVAFLGAVSLSFPLLFSHLLAPPLPPPSSTPTRSRHALLVHSPPSWNAWLWPACVTLALVSTAALPLTATDERSRPLFISALAIVHSVLALPFLAAMHDKPAVQAEAPRTSAAGLSPTGLWLLAAACAAMHAWATATALDSLLPTASTLSADPPAAVADVLTRLVGAASRNVCQQSIAIDACLSTFTGTVFMIASSRGAVELWDALTCVVLTPLIGPGAALAVFSARRAERYAIAPSAGAVAAGADAHWANFLYSHTPRHWHALWCRWGAGGELKAQFGAERVFVPVEGGCDMSVVYHYSDDRGTVREGPQCGPWRITKAVHSASDGLLHPSSADMTTLLLPVGGPSAWCMKRSVLGEQPCAVELFLHHGEHLRMSAGVIHGKDGALVQLSAIREDARGMPSPDWSTSTDATKTDAAGLAAALRATGAPVEALGAGFAISAGLAQRAISGEWASTRVGGSGASPADAVLLCPDSIAVVAPSARTAGEPFTSAAAWWPKAPGDVAPTLYTIEARWGVDGALEEVRYLVFGEAAV